MASYYRFTGEIAPGTLAHYKIVTPPNGSPYFEHVGVVSSDIMLPHLRKEIARQRDFKIPGGPPEGFYGLCVYSESPSDPQERTTIVEVPRESVVNKGFRKRSAEGEIVVSPMKIGKLTIVETPFAVQSRIFHRGSQGRSLETDPTLEHLKLDYTTCAIIDGQYYGGQWYAINEGVTDEKFDYMPFNRQFYLDLLKSGEIDDKLVTDTAAALNEATLDLLTELAELPDTIKMAQDVLRFAGNKVKGFRTAEKALKKKLLKQGVPRNELELADTLASLRLQWRYGILPLTYTLEDLKNVLKDKFKAEYVKHSGIKNVVLDLEDGFQGACVSTQTCWMKRRFDPSDKTAQFQRVFAVNPAKTAWELTTLSFVVDWFINVGDVLSTITPYPSLEEKATFSWRNSVQGSITKPDYPNGLVTIDLQYYEIKPINFQDHVVLKFQPLLTSARKLDGLALGWSFLRSTFRKLK